MIILKQDRYVDFTETETMTMASDNDVLSISKNLIDTNRKAYEELAK